MPSPADFRRAFELQRGALLGGKQQFEIEASVVGHEVSGGRLGSGGEACWRASPPMLPAHLQLELLLAAVCLLHTW
jgi:hypothetical protein